MFVFCLINNSNYRNIDLYHLQYTNVAFALNENVLIKIVTDAQHVDLI